MGLDISVVMADWARLARIPARERLDAVTDVVYPDHCCDACFDADLARPAGWAWQRQADWCAEYRFHGTTGSYSWHFQLSNAWDDLRDSAAPGLRAALDLFLGGLMWDGPEGPAETDDLPPVAGGFPDDAEPWRPRVLLLRAPDEVARHVRAWEAAGPRLEELRGPFEAECAGWAGRPRTFDAAAALLREWGEVVTGAGARGWGLIGLPY
ncbi:hypothetical protein [Streptomyces sp. NPDC029003]|uniref:hypothetical protein n=1 Tax=Streptomyces sp. NPDC029003 TaxID=3155125 RepID=UPI0034032946